MPERKISFETKQKEEKACLQGCLFDCSLKKMIQKHVANCWSVNILQTCFDVLRYHGSYALLQNSIIVHEENDIVL